MPGISRFFPLSCEPYIPVSTAFSTLKSLWLDPQAVVHSFIGIRIVVFIWVLIFHLVSSQTQRSLETQWKKAREQNLQKHGLLELTLRTGKSCKGQECNSQQDGRWSNCTVNSAFCANGFVRYAGSLHRSLSNQVKLTCSHGYFKNYEIRVFRISCMVYELGY